jgi:hypothetical protein
MVDMKKKVFVIDTGNIPSEDVGSYMEKLRKEASKLNGVEVEILAHIHKQKPTKWQRFKNFVKSILNPIG